MRRAKIVCTLGPATSSPEQVRALVEAGMDFARLNLSHGDYADHERSYLNVRRASDETGRAVGILADLQGPKIRLGRFADGPHELAAGDTFTITTEDVVGTPEVVSTTYRGLSGDVAPGDAVLVDDGRVALRVTAVDGPRVVTEVEVPGPVSNNKGINLPGVAVSVPALSDKDAQDLRWALRRGVDMVALSFVRRAEDVEDVRRIMTEEGVFVPVLAKIEKPQAVDNLAEIVAAFDGIMVARGDLGVELPLEQVPLVQKRAVELARRNAKPVIVATQMLESMISSPRPTRAEASDCANAVLDGADALMLSGETSVGRYPVEAVRTMARIIENTEEHGLERIVPLGTRPHTTGGAVTWAAREVGELLDVRYLVTFTQSGDSARRMSRLRSRIPVLAFTPEPAVRSQLALTWGIETFLVPPVRHTDEMVRQVDQALLSIGRLERGESVVIVAGSPPGVPGSTNAMRIHRMGAAVDGVAPAYREA
ncbi:pyruvate kinase [Quadrisphaera sp. GCM10027208]|uniref:pyruvate kinase n=1 Tax=Quadrisphaera sp. GCM10027208 TaxID=3273423 RepID=UPI00361B6A1C